MYYMLYNSVVMPRSINISEARARLPELARYLRRSPSRVVFIEHRDMEERLALITEGRLRYLEALVAAAARRADSAFRLAGSMSSALTDDELEQALLDVKQDQTTRSSAKVDEY